MNFKNALAAFGLFVILCFVLKYIYETAVGIFVFYSIYHHYN